MGYTLSPKGGGEVHALEGEVCYGRTTRHFVIRLKDGESMASLCREFGISRKTGYKIFERCGNSPVSKAPPIAPGDLSATPINFRCTRLPSSLRNARSRTGGRERFGSACCGSCRMRSRFRPPAQSTLSWIGMVWSAAHLPSANPGAGHAAVRRSESQADLWCADHKGEFISSAISATVIHSPSPIRPRAFWSPALCASASNPHAKIWRFRPSSACVPGTRPARGHPLR